MRRTSPWWNLAATALAAVTVTVTILAALAAPAAALNYVYDQNQDYWAVEDAAVPGLDTGSIHNTATGSLQGFGGIRMQVNGAPTTPMLNGVLLRGFGLTYDGVNSFTSHHAVELGGVAVTRSLYINQTGNYALFYDTFTNTSASPLSIDVAFGGQLGYDTGFNQSSVVATSSADSAPSPADAWVEVATPTTAPGTPSENGPSAVVLGTPAPFSGAITGTGDFLEQPFSRPLPTTGDEANEYGYTNHLMLAAGQTKALAHFVVLGLSEVKTPPAGGPVPAAGSQVTAVANEASVLAATPDFARLTTGQLCALSNWSMAAIAAGVPGFAASKCTSSTIINDPAPVAPDPPATTSSPYNVVGKTIVQELADMKSGATTSQDIVRAYLDRIAAYDEGPLGFHAIIDVNPNAMAEARQADAERAAGDTRPLLGIPVLVKDIYDTSDLPTTGGSLVFYAFQPEQDAFLVARLRAAGAIILGKSNLAEFATDGYFSPSAYGQVWNAFDPSKSSIGSSGGSTVAVALSLAAAALGTQTGDSLWGPSSAASLVSLRGTDGLTSTQGVMPLTYIQDYAGAFTRTVQDQALILNAIAAVNPDDPTQALEGSGWAGKRPADWSSYLNADALEGKRIGYYTAAFTDPFNTTATSNAMMSEFQYFARAGATIVQIPPPPGPPSLPHSGDFNYEGWLKWIQENPNSPYQDPGQIINNQLRLPLFRASSPIYTGTGPTTDAQNAAFVAYRQAYQAELAQWMADNNVDAVVFPGELSNIHLNDSIQPSFGRLDPQASNAGVPTAIFPAGLNPDGQPDNLQLEGPDYSDPELLGMAYAFEQVAHGHEQSPFAPPLPYDPSAAPPSLPTTPTPVPAPTTTAPSAPDKPSVPASAVATKVLPTVKLLAGPWLRKGTIGLRLGCTSTKGSCRFVLRLAIKGKAPFTLQLVTVGAGKKRTLALKPSRALLRKLTAHKHTKVVVTLVPVAGTAVATLKTTVALTR
jgi:amidase